MPKDKIRKPPGKLSELGMRRKIQEREEHIKVLDEEIKALQERISTQFKIVKQLTQENEYLRKLHEEQRTRLVLAEQAVAALRKS